jgi:hypothetical protein
MHRVASKPVGTKSWTQTETRYEVDRPLDWIGITFLLLLDDDGSTHHMCSCSKIEH